MSKVEVHNGVCRCGQVRFQVTGQPMATFACHCTGCQRMTASAFSLSAMYPDDRFAVISGEPVIGGLHGTDRHFFCPHCMSWLFTRPGAVEGFVNVRTPMLDDAVDFPPFVETYTSEALPFVKTSAIHSFEKFPTMEQFPELLAAYAEHVG